MFNFHKPKVYRSTQGCCICKAKSSSSRFTDSKKYEEAFEQCFELKEKRSGEVCNACVLLVKRWRNLPENSDRNWKHVVDARAGPGTRTLSKTKSLKSKKRKLKEKSNDDDEIDKVEEEDLAKVLVKVANGGNRSIPMDIKDMDVNEDCDSPSPTPSDDAFPLKHSRGKQTTAINEPGFGYGFLDATLWRRVKVCCGVIFEGPCGAVVIDPLLMMPCSGRHRTQEKEAVPPVTETKKELITEEVKMEVETITPSVVVQTIAVAVADKLIVADTGKAFNDASSDSGYDESSNQGENVVNSKQILPGSQAQKVNNSN